MEDNLEFRQKMIAEKVADIMGFLGIDCNESTKKTPERVAKMLTTELFSSQKPTGELDERMTIFRAPNQNKINVKGIRFTSMCEHHLLPFTGYADVEYVPNVAIIGLSKIPRVVKWFSKRAQVQERLTQEIGEYLVGCISPLYLKVTLRNVRHSCVEIRGVQAECSTDTVYEYKKEGYEG
jgi:GTP cyclohydrolase I